MPNKSKTTTGASKTTTGASKSKRPSVAILSTDATKRTFKIEAILVASKAPLTVRQIEDECARLYTNNEEGREDSVVRAARRHIDTLYQLNYVEKKDGAYIVRPEVIKALKSGARGSDVRKLGRSRKLVFGSAPSKKVAPVKKGAKKTK